MLLSGLSIILLILAVFLFAISGSRKSVRLAVPVAAGVVALLTLVWLVLNSITGAGINDAVFYHLHSGLGGGDVSQYFDLIALAVGGFLVLVYGCWRMFKALPQGRAPRRGTDLLVLGLLMAAVTSNAFTVDVSRYVARQYFTEQQTEGFTDPVILSRPAKPKNLVVIYLESLERTYFDQDQFPGLIEDLRQIEAKGATFTGLGQSIGAGFTIGGMVAGQCGVPLLIAGGENSLHVSRFLSGATCLGDLLKAEGYHTEFMGGASTEFAGKGSFYESHGFDQVIGLEDLKPGLADPDYLGPWGLQDDTLFDLVGKRIDDLARSPDPFAMVMLTLDTHHPDGHANTNRSCKDVSYGDGSNAMLTSVKCSDRLVAAFVQDLLNGPRAEDTVIVLASDHLAMVNGAADELSQVERNNFFVILEPGAAPETISRKGSTLDAGPTIMAALGYDVPQIGFGVNLRGQAPTLAEQHLEETARTDLFSEYLMGFQAIYARLWDYPKIGDGFYVNIEGGQAQFGAASFKIPALMKLDAEGGIVDVVLEDHLANGSLSSAVLEADPNTPVLWFDRCITLAKLNPEAVLPDGLCLGSGALTKTDFKVQPLPRSLYLSRDKILPDLASVAEDPASLERRRQALRLAAVADGSLPLNVALPREGYHGRDFLFRSAAAGRGASWSRLLTTDSLDAGADIVLGRGINLIGVASDGGTKVLSSLDPCGASKDPQAAFKATIAANAGFAFFAVVIHDTAVCDESRAVVDKAAEGLNLPVLQRIAFRQPYVAILALEGTAQERIGPEGGRVLVRVGTQTENASFTAPAATPPVSQNANAPELTATEPSAPTPAAKSPEPAATAAATATGLTSQDSSCVQPPDLPNTPQATSELPADQAMTLSPLVPASMIGFGSGWWDPEDAGRWAGSSGAEFSILLPKSGGTLEIAGVPYHRTEMPVEIRAGERVLLNDVLVEGRALRVDLSGLQGGAVQTLTLNFPDAAAACPASEGASTDRRALVAMIQSVRLVTAVGGDEQTASPTPTMPTEPAFLTDAACMRVPQGDDTSPTQALQVGLRAGIGDSDVSGFVGHGNGWWASEPFGRWIGSDNAVLKVRLPEGDDPIELEISGQSFQEKVIGVELRFGDRLLFKGDFGADRPIIVPASDLPRGEVLSLDIAFSIDAATCPKALGQSGDARTLVAMINTVALRAAPTASPSAARDRLPSVAHAGGEVAGTRITDSLDALNANSPFYDLLEIDLSWTSDRRLVCLHDWEDSFAYRFGYKTALPLTEADFVQSVAKSIPDRPENCTLTSLVQWLRDNPTKRIVTDLKEDNLLGLQLIASTYPDLKDRFLPQAYQPGEIAQIKAMGFRDIIWTLYKYDGDRAAVLAALADNPVYALAMPEERAASGLAMEVLAATGVRSYVHTVNSPTLAECYATLGVSGIYTDILRGPMPDSNQLDQGECIQRLQ